MNTSQSSPTASLPKPKTDPETNRMVARDSIVSLSELQRESDSGSRISDRLTRTPLSLYLREIGQVRLLTIEEEVELADRIKNGDEAAREHMIRANLRLVVKIARDYENLGLPLLDLINEGNIGLMKAVERFDPKKGGKFSTYGSYWIKQSIKRALANQSKVIRLPVHVQERIFKMRRTQHRWQELHGRNPDRQELSEELGLGDMIVRRMEQACLTMNSLDAPVGDDESSKLGDLIMDEKAPTAFEEMDQRMMHGLVLGMLGTLSQRELTIIRERLGHDGGPARTLEDIAAKFSLTRERIRQLQNVALHKLREQFEKLDERREQTLAA
jgi:RNA polymerase primary sigma factor